MAHGDSMIARMIHEIIDIKYLRNIIQLQTTDSILDPSYAVFLGTSVLPWERNRFEKVQNLIVAHVMRDLPNHELSKQAIVFKRIVFGDRSELPIFHRVKLVTTDGFRAADVVTVVHMAVSPLGAYYDAPEEIIVFKLSVALALAEEMTLAREEGYHGLTFVFHAQVALKYSFQSL